MRISFYFLLGLLGATAIAQATGQSVHLRPDSSSPVVGELEADAWVVPAEASSLTDEQVRAGWQAVSFLDDFRGFVRRSDLTKDLEVRPGAKVYLKEKADRDQILATAESDDLFEIERLSGEWVEVTFRKPITGYTRKPGQETASSERRAERNEPEDEPEDSGIEDVPAPRDEEVEGPVVSRRDGMPTDGELRLFEGRLMPVRSFLGRKQPFDYQMVDNSGNRIAYLDLKKLLITTPLDRFYDRSFQFYGRAEPIEGRREFVIRVEHMRLN